MNPIPPDPDIQSDTPDPSDPSDPDIPSDMPDPAISARVLDELMEETLHRARLGIARDAYKGFELCALYLLIRHGVAQLLMPRFWLFLVAGFTLASFAAYITGEIAYHISLWICVRTRPNPDVAKILAGVLKLVNFGAGLTFNAIAYHWIMP